MTIFSLPTFSYTPPPSPLLHTLGARVGVGPPPWGPFCNFFPMWEPYCYVFLLKGNLFYHMGAFLVHFSPYVELILPCGGLFGTFFSLWGTFFTMWGSFFSMWGPLATFSSLLGPFFYHVGRQSYHVEDVLLRFFFIGNLFYHVVAFLLLFSPFGVLFCTYGERFCTYTWGLFVHMGEAYFVHMGGILGSPPPVRIFLRAPVCPLPSHTI